VLPRVNDRRAVFKSNGLRLAILKARDAPATTERIEYCDPFARWLRFKDEEEVWPLRRMVLALSIVININHLDRRWNISGTLFDSSARAQAKTRRI